MAYGGGGMMPPQQGGGMMPPQQGGGMMPPQMGGGMMPPQMGGGMPHPGAPHQAPPQWNPGQGGPPGAGNFQAMNNGPMQFGDVNIPNYGNMGPVGQMMNLPPPPPPPPPSGPPPDMAFTDLSVMDESACRDAVIQFASEQCCYGSAPAAEMTFDSVVPKTALHYTLETYGEARSTGYKTKPYRGEFVDGPQNGQPPPPWAMPCEPNELFKNQVKLFEVPHTSFVKPCQRCHAKGWVYCKRCQGDGRHSCNSCGGRGRTTYHDHEGNSHERDCPHCHHGQQRCNNCGGDGRIKCRTCDGYGQLRAYVELKVDYQNHLNDYIMEQTDMPDELVRTVGGKPVFEQTLPQVWPICAYPIREVNENSNNLVKMHQNQFREERKIMQRQVLRAVPVTEVQWDWKDARNKRLWVYGNEHRVYCPDYPQQCCWGCSVM